MNERKDQMNTGLGRVVWEMAGMDWMRGEDNNPAKAGFAVKNILLFGEESF